MLPVWHLRVTVLKMHMINIVSIILRSFLKECCPAISPTLKSRLGDYVGTPFLVQDARLTITHWGLHADHTGLTTKRAHSMD